MENSPLPQESIANDEGLGVFEFSKEEVEREVLQKVTDINEKGTAFTAVRKHTLEKFSKSLSLEKTPKFDEVVDSILTNGILGTFGLKKEEENHEGVLSFKDAIKQKWIASRKEGYGGNLFVNIVGEDLERISDSFAEMLQYKEYIGFVMDLSTYQEQIPIRTKSSLLGGEKPAREGKGRAKHIRAYSGNSGEAQIGVDVLEILHTLGIPVENIHRANYGEIVDMLVTNKDRHEDVNMTDGQYADMIEKVSQAGSIGNIFGIKKTDWTTVSEGYTVGHRVAPRYIKGIVLPCDGRIPLEDLIQEALNGMELASEEKKQNLFLPIYDPEGNLLWPQKITHKEIIEMKKDEAARDASIEQ